MRQGRQLFGRALGRAGLLPTAPTADPVEMQLFLDLLSLGKPAQMRAFGRSMLPCIWPGMLVEITPVGPRTELAVGDVLLVLLDSDLLLHRLIEVGPSGALTLKGDNRSSADPAVARCDVRGRVTRLGADRWACRTTTRAGKLIGRSVASISLASWRRRGAPRTNSDREHS